MNTIDRVYPLRGKEVHLQEVTDFVAVRNEPTVKPLRFRTLESEVVDEALPQIRALRNAGWKFVPRQEAAEGAKVYLKSGGRVALGTNRLTVRVAGEHSLDEARELLQRRGLKILNQLKYASNLFSVAVPPGHDVLEESTRLATSGDFEFAEPELIEVVPGR